jgi:uncharacterized protein involved in tolerance to divalent cations
LKLIVCKMESGKTNDVIKHLLITDRLVQQGNIFSSKFLYNGSVEEDHETYSTFKKTFKTSIIQIPLNN